ncbi:MAG: hypothetical protein HS126_00005 [Anaerolineales bacterium]|nr:hypothetical protein [Anaerolineales bacterium]
MILTQFDFTTTGMAAILPAKFWAGGLALFYALIGERDPALAQKLHDLDGPKPFTASNPVLQAHRVRCRD